MQKMQVQIFFNSEPTFLIGLCWGYFFVSVIFRVFFCRGNSDNEWLIVVFNILGRASSTGTLALCYIYSAEIFPTVVRNVGIGSSSVWVRIINLIRKNLDSRFQNWSKLEVFFWGLKNILGQGTNTRTTQNELYTGLSLISNFIKMNPKNLRFIKINSLNLRTVKMN